MKLLHVVGSKDGDGSTISHSVRIPRSQKIWANGFPSDNKQEAVRERSRKTARKNIGAGLQCLFKNKFSYPGIYKVFCNVCPVKFYTDKTTRIINIRITELLRCLNNNFSEFASHLIFTDTFNKDIH